MVMESIFKAQQKKKFSFVQTRVPTALTASQVQDNYRGED